jgi:hypothetical protein
VVVLELQKFLTSAGNETNLTVGSPLEFQIDSSRYDAKVRRFYQPEARDPGRGAADPPQTDQKSNLIDLKEQLGALAAGRVTFLFDEARKPGLYLFELTRLPEEGNASAPPKTEQRAFAFNVDPVESDLRRAAKDDLERAAAGVRLRNPGSGWAGELANRQSDLSEWPWFYLLFLVVLVVEQALAVHLSFHLKGAEGAAVGRPAPRAQPAGA